MESQTELAQPAFKVVKELFRILPVLKSNHESSRPGESHPGALTEPCLNLSAHTALPMQPPCGERYCSVHRGPPVTGCPDIRNCIGHPLRSSPITGPSPLLRGGPPLCPASVLSRSRGPPLAVLPSHRGDRFPRSAQEPGSRSCRLHAGCRPDSKQVPSGLVPG